MFAEDVARVEQENLKERYNGLVALKSKDGVITSSISPELLLRGFEAVEV